MKVMDLLYEALAAIRAHALRSFLTLLGIIIGVSTIVGVVSVISGLDSFVKEKVIDFSPDVWVLTKFGIIRSREEFLEAVRRPDITWQEYERLTQLVRESNAIAASIDHTAPVKFQDRRLADVRVNGVTANLPSLYTVDIVAGRFFLDAEARAAQGVAVIGWDVKEELFPQMDPVGRYILVGGARYRVIGLMAKKGQMLGQNRDNLVYVPIQTLRQQIGTRDSLDMLVRASGGVPGVDRSIDEVRAIFRAMRHTSYKSADPFGTVTAEALQDLWKQISRAAFMLMILISSVSLLVGGIVIMNIMLVSVIERTSEIGVRKAVGADERAIRRQFVLEATMLSLGGGVVGAGIGSAAALALRFIVGFPARVTPLILLTGLGLAAVVGILAGAWPAWNASRLNAIDALRAE